MRTLPHPAIPALAATLAAALGLTLLASQPSAAPPVVPKTFDLGSGPTVVVLHDLGGSRLSWMPTLRKLIGHYHVVLMDLPGHGDTPLPDPFTLDAAAEAVDQVLAKQDPAQTVLVAKGMGGLIALLELKAHPDRVRGLVLVDAGTRAPMKIDEQQMKYFTQYLDEHYAEFLKAAYSQAGRDSAEGVAVHALATQTPPQTMKAYLGAALTVDASPVVKTLKCPLLFVATDRLMKGGKDWPTVAKSLGYDDPAAIPMRHIEGSGYFVMRDQADSLAAILADFTTRAVEAKK